MNKINIDNVEYDIDKLSNEAKAQLISMQFCDQELQRLQSQAAALQTARQAYAKALQASLAAEAIQGDKISFN
jgi:type II secretory pathway component PulM